MQKETIMAKNPVHLQKTQKQNQKINLRSTEEIEPKEKKHF